MASLQLFRCILFIFLFRNTFCSHGSDCNMEEFRVKANFDENQFQGKWYEISWILLPWIKPEWNYNDYIHNYTKTEYGFSIYAQGRWPDDAKECANATFPKLFSTGENAKYIHEYEAENGTVNSTLWIMDTDYKNYALVIGCSEVAPNGTCVAPDSWLWTRCPNPPMSHKMHMEDKLRDYCLSKDLFQTTYHRMECRADIPDACASAPTPAEMREMVISITVAVMMVILSFP